MNLNEHIESVHAGKKPFKCNVCDAGLKWRSESLYKILHDCGAPFPQMHINSVHKRRKVLKTHCVDLDLNDQKTRQNF